MGGDRARGRSRGLVVAIAVAFVLAWIAIASALIAWVDRPRSRFGGEEHEQDSQGQIQGATSRTRQRVPPSAKVRAEPCPASANGDSPTRAMRPLWWRGAWFQKRETQESGRRSRPRNWRDSILALLEVQHGARAVESRYRADLEGDCVFKTVNESPRIPAAWTVRGEVPTIAGARARVVGCRASPLCTEKGCRYRW